MWESGDFELSCKKNAWKQEAVLEVPDGLVCDQSCCGVTEYDEPVDEAGRER